MSWYYAINKVQHGPLSLEDLTALIEAGTIERSTLVWEEGMASWQPAGETALRPLFSSDSPAPLPLNTHRPSPPSTPPTLMAPQLQASPGSMSCGW